MKSITRSSLVVVLLVAISFAPTPAPACSLVPTLWGTVEESELIVLARVDSVELAPPSDEASGRAFRFARDTAVLRVLETWKGSSRAEVRVQFFSHPRSTFREGEVVLAFLVSGETRAAREAEAWAEDPDEAEWREAGIPPEEFREAMEMATRGREEARAFATWAPGRWFDAGPLSPEIGRPAESEREALRELVELAVRLQTAGEVGLAEHREWLVKAAALRITRSESVSSLLWMTKEPPPFAEDDGEMGAEEGEDDGEARPAPLTNEELARIAAGFVRQPEGGYPAVAMLQLLATYPDLEVDRTAAAFIEAGLILRPIPGWVTAMVEEALRRYGDDFSVRIGRDDVDSRGRPIYTGPGENTLGTIWAVARRELGIPEVLPAELPAPEPGYLFE
jgi:hypothetical protein